MQEFHTIKLKWPFLSSILNPYILYVHEEKSLFMKLKMFMNPCREVRKQTCHMSIGNLISKT